MSIETKEVKTGKRYRANVYMKGERLTGSWRKQKKEAEQDEVDFKHQLFSGSYVKETKKTFDECTQIYLDVTAPKHMNANTIYGEKCFYDKHIKPVFGDRQIASIKPYEVQKLWTEKEQTLSSSSITRMHNIMNKVFKQFVKWDEIKQNPMSKVEKPRIRYKRTDVWSKEEVKKFLMCAKDFQTYIVFWLALNTGMRQGEILALHWDDIDFEKQEIHVKYNLDRMTQKRGTLKTESSERIIYLTDSQLHVLKKHKKSQDPKTDIVCSSTVGTYLMPRNIRRAMQIICDNTGLKQIRFHDLRHTHGTLFLSVTKDVKATQERLGHADVRMTLERYVHSSNKIHQETANQYADFMGD